MAYLSFPTVDATTAKALPGPSKYTPEIRLKLKTSSFGDSYTQTTPDGINYKLYTWSLSWENLRLTELNTIWSFLEARGGYMTFLWTDPKTNTVKKIKCKEFSHDYVSTDVWNLTAKFEESVI